jgi:2-phosphosulfolactate phosphatase
MTKLEVLFSPAEFNALGGRDLSNTRCVVFDILRATSTMITALQNGAEAVLPVATIDEAVSLKRENSRLLLGGEREGFRITAQMTGGVDFDLGNSPREYTPERVRGRKIVMTTTNGTRGLRSCAGAAEVLAGSFLNLAAIASHLAVTIESRVGQAPSPVPPGASPGESAPNKPDEKVRAGEESFSGRGARWDRRGRLSYPTAMDVLLVCSGTHEEASFEDTLAAGALTDLLWPRFSAGHIADSAQIAREIYRSHADDLPGAMQLARNGRRLLNLPELAADVPFCLQRDAADFNARMAQNGWISRIDSAKCK